MSMDGGMLVVTVVAIAVGMSMDGGMLVVTVVVAIAVGMSMDGGMLVVTVVVAIAVGGKAWNVWTNEVYICIQATRHDHTKVFARHAHTTMNLTFTSTSKL